MTVEPTEQSAQIPDRHRLGDDIRESVPVRVLRGMRWLSRFGYWSRSGLSAVAMAVRDWVSSAISGSQPPPQDVTCDPSYYRQLLECPWVPDRPQLTELERASPGEAGAIASVARMVSGSVIGSYCHSRTADPAARATRAQHAKHHGCVQASFVVHQNLAPEFAVGVFRPGARYPAVIRFSNAMGSRQSDKSVDGRGMAVKLRNVNGTSLLWAQRSQPGATEQDFLISGHPVFFCRNADDYTAFMTMLALPRNTRVESIIGAAKFALFFLRRPFRVLRAFVATAIQPVTSPVEMVYHSMTAYEFGADKVVRYIATPLAKPSRAPKKNRGALGENYLHDALVAALSPDSHSDGAPIAFDFSIQIRHEPTSTDVEDTNLRWRGRHDVTVSLGRIEIPMQRFDMGNQERACEDISFNPWNCLPEHRPLGSLNRMRLAVYMASTKVRHRLNGL